MPDFGAIGAGWLLVLGFGLGVGIGTQAGRWSVYALMRNPLGQLAGAYRRLFADIGRLWCTGRWT